MKKAKCFSDIHYDIGKIDDKMYSSFTEHLGRSIYTGIYEPGHPNADEDGYRKDVMELVKELGVPVIRYPGGNFVSCYDWHDGIGPKEKRPKRMDYAWSSIETNQFGIDEFCQWAEKVGIEPMIAVNLGTGSIKDAGDLVEYCNHPGGTYWSDLRAQNGHPEPYNIKYWCLGNEMEGSWQAGHLSAEDYTKKALEAAKIMRWVDPSIKLVACGSSYEMLPTYMEWDRTMLTDLYNQVDYLSTHNYTMNSGQGTTNYLASYKQLDSHIKNSAKVIEYVKAKNHFDKDLKICLDEWNVWNFQDIKLDSLDDLMGLTTFEMTSAGKWEIAPPILQEKYSLEERKLIEVVRALYTNPRIFIVDETTTALSQRGRDIIYQVIKNMKKENKTVLFISHDLEELMEVCSKLIVLRDGVFVAELEKSEFEEEKIKELMVGRKLTGDYYRSDYDGSYGKEVVLSAEKLYVGDSLKGVSLELHKGEILGIGGLTDCGMHELGKALFGNVKSLYGEVKLGNGKKITSEKQAIKNKIGYVSKNRDQEALILSASIMENTVLPSLSMIAKGGVITKGAEKKFTDKQVKDMSIKCREIGQNVGDLSGGNKQKVVFGKWLGNESEIYILDCPTRGIDIGVKAFMYQLMYRLKKEGKSILMISEELPELIGMSDRILIMKDGQIQDSFTRSEELNESVLIKKMV